MVKEGACGSELEVERQTAVEVLASGGPGEVYGVGIGHQWIYQMQDIRQMSP